MEVILIAIVLVGISFLALGINIFFRRDGKFPETEVGKNRKMRELGIVCTKCEEHRKYRNAKNKNKPNLNPSVLKLDIEGLNC
jgi:hypothetical protein